MSTLFINKPSPFFVDSQNPINFLPNHICFNFIKLISLCYRKIQINLKIHVK